MTATTFWWVRHGPTHARTMIGWTDRPADLSDRATLDWLNATLPRGAPVIASDLTRARQTAEALARGRVRLPDDPDLRELNFGAWEDMGFDAAEARDGDRLRAFWDRPGDVSAPGGESWNDLKARVGRAAARLEGHAPDVIVVAHMGPILSRVEMAQGLSPRQAFGHRIAPLSLTVVTAAGADPIGQLPDRR